MSEETARQLTEEIRDDLLCIVERRDRVKERIARASNESAHTDLGYPSWTAYVSAEFGGLLARLDAAERRPLVHDLRQLGMSSRAIAPIIGVHHDTVASDLRSGVGFPTPDLEPVPPMPPVTGLDGKQYPVASRPPVKSDDDLLSELDRKRDQQKREQAERRQADVERFEQTARAVHALANISGPWMSDYDDALVDHYTREAFDRQRLLTAQAHLKELVAWSHNRTTGHSSSTR